MNNIRALRLEKGWSQAELANRVGVNQTAVSKWELDSSLPDMNSTKKLAELFDVSMDYIHGLVEEDISRQLRRLSVQSHERMKRASLLPLDFLHQFASLELPDAYYQVVDQFHRDASFRQIYFLWSQLMASQKQMLIEYAEGLVNNMDVLDINDGGYPPPEDDR